MRKRNPFSRPDILRRQGASAGHPSCEHTKTNRGHRRGELAVVSLEHGARLDLQTAAPERRHDEVVFDRCAAAWEAPGFGRIGGLPRLACGWPSRRAREERYSGLETGNRKGTEIENATSARVGRSSTCGASEVLLAEILLHGDRKHDALLLSKRYGRDRRQRVLRQAIIRPFFFVRVLPRSKVRKNHPWHVSL